MKYLHTLHTLYIIHFNVEELKERTLSLMGAATIFSTFYVIFIKMTIFAK